MIPSLRLGLTRYFVCVVTFSLFSVAHLDQGLSDTDVRIPEEYTVKAAFVYNFIKFVKWPQEQEFYQDKSLLMCVVGQGPMTDALKSISGRTVHGRLLIVKYCPQAECLKKCDVVFVTRHGEDRTDEILEAAKRSHILTISDMDGFTKKGGIIGMSLENNRIRFDINLKAAREASLKISSRLLKLARKVIR